ncbi:MAG: RNA polymerase sigma factor (sigma-70 family) [Lentimonas sp.]|jgi:RNA polymerase sigma factor (sigma-70 family)
MNSWSLGFKKVYEDHSQMVFNLALQYTQNAEDAQEITQDVFVKVHEKMGSFSGKSELRTWIYRISINESLDYLKAKKRKKRSFLFLSQNPDQIENQAVNFDHPGVLLENQEELSALFEKINDLPSNQKTALILLKIEGLPQSEVAKIMKVSEKAVESLFQRAKRNLKNKLN